MSKVETIKSYLLKDICDSLNPSSIIMGEHYIIPYVYRKIFPESLSYFSRAVDRMVKEDFLFKASEAPKYGDDGKPIEYGFIKYHRIKWENGKWMISHFWRGFPQKSLLNNNRRKKLVAERRRNGWEPSYRPFDWDGKIHSVNVNHPYFVKFLISIPIQERNDE